MKQTLQPYKARNFLLILLLTLFANQLSLAQSAKYIISGIVKDARTGGAMPGVVVRLAGSTAAASTNANGAYTLQADVSAGTYQLNFNFIGYKPLTKPVQLNSGNVTVDVQLAEDALNLNEVVVTGTAVATSKKQLGNAISTVSAKDIENSTATSIDQAMAGKIAGAQITQNSGNPAGGISVRLRGSSTVVGSGDPLYIIDGVIVNNSSDQLVDLGGYSQNRLVDINPADVDHIEIIKGAAAAAIYGSRASNGVVQIFTKKGKAGKPVINVSTQFRYNSIRKKLAYNDYPYRFTNFTSTDLSQVAVQRYDYQSEIFRSAFGTEDNISVSGGNDNTQYYVSGGFLGNQGIIDNTNFQRGSGRVKIDQRLNKWLKASVGMNYSLSGSKEIPNGGISEAYGALTGFIFSNNYIDPHPNATTGVYPSTSPTNYVTRTNPLEAINRFDFDQKTSRFIGDIQLTATPVKDLSINYTLGYDNSTQSATGFIPVGNTTPSYNQGYSRKADRIDLLLNNDLNIAYKTKIGSLFQSSTAFGATAQTEHISTTSITGTQLGPVSQVATNGAVLAATDVRSVLNILGFYAQETLGYKDKVFVTGAIRNDASSSFGIKNRWQYYPKASVAYVLSEEDFWKNSALGSIIPNFKLRASYGQSGNLTAIGAYDRLTNYTSVSVAGLPGVTSGTQLGNPNIKPERQTEKEVGLDASFLNDRLGFEFSYYQKDVKDLILLANLNPTSGYLTQYQNVGNMTNKGIELLLRGVPVQAERFQWNSTVTFSINRNKVYNIPGGMVTFASGFSAVAAINGSPLGVFYGPYFARNTDGSLLLTAAGLPQVEKSGRNAAGQPTGTTLYKVIGNPNPKWTGSFINEFNIGKRWSLRAQLDASYGGEIFDFTRRVGERDLYGGLAGYEAELKGDVPKGTSAALWSIYENWIEDGSYLKVRELSASYSIKPKFLKNNTMRITLSGRNLFSIDNYKGYDPETSSAGQSTAVRGFDFVEVPLPRTIALALNVTF